MYDRTWMVVDKYNNMITQRVIPKMVLITTEIDEVNNLLIIRSSQHDDNQDYKELTVPLEINDKNLKINNIHVTIWGETCDAIDCGNKANEWFSNILNESDCKLVRFPNSYNKVCNPLFAPNHYITFQDGFPFLLVSTKSLEYLNSMITTLSPTDDPITYENFRPNIIISPLPSGGDELSPFEEDSWKSISIGNMNMDIVKPCSRCKIPTNNPNTGILNINNEPTKTLKTFRIEKLIKFISFFGTNVCIYTVSTYIFYELY